jgi:hypothetical protein
VPHVAIIRLGKQRVRAIAKGRGTVRRATAARARSAIVRVVLEISGAMERTVDEALWCVPGCSVDLRHRAQVG